MSKKQSATGSERPDTPRRRRLRENWKVLEPTIPLRPFVDFAWENYDPKAVAAYLLEPGKSFYRHKSILHEGFCAWVACPGRRKLRQDGMVYRIAKAVDDAEAPWREGASAFNHSVGETVGRMLRADRRFFEEVYYPIGGATRFVGAMSRAAFKGSLGEHVTEMLEAVHLMALHHYHLTHLTDKKTFHIPSKEAGANLLKTAFGAPTSSLFREGLHKQAEDDRYKLRGETNVIASWNQSRPAVAYAYAAASLETGEGRTLLHEIVGCKSTRVKHQHLIPEWCGRARYAVESIIERCHPEREPFDYRARLLDVETVPFELPFIFPFSDKTIADGYKNAPVKLAERRAEKIASLGGTSV